MKTKNIVIISSLIIASLLFGLFWVVAPANMKDKVVGLITFASADRQWFNYYKNEKNYFTDPDSAYIESSRILTLKDNAEELSQYPAIKDAGLDSDVQIKVRAHNGMGGYVSDSIHCPLSQNKFHVSDQSKYTISKFLHDSDEAIEKDRSEICGKVAAREKGNIYNDSDDLKKYIEENCSK